MHKNLIKSFVGLWLAFQWRENELAWAAEATKATKQ